jgi:hypothetical protein
MFGLGSPPYTRRQNILFGIYCAACITFTATLIGYSVWAANKIAESMLFDVDVRRVSVITLNCSKRHFWGHYIFYNTRVPGDVYLHTGKACYDRAKGEWELTQDADYWSSHAPSK